MKDRTPLGISTTRPDAGGLPHFIGLPGANRYIRGSGSRLYGNPSVYVLKKHITSNKEISYLVRSPILCVHFPDVL